MHLYSFILSVVYFYSERPSLSKYFILCVVYFYNERPPLLPGRVARDFGGINQIYIYIYTKQFWFTTRMVLDYTLSTAMIFFFFVKASIYINVFKAKKIIFR